MSEPADSVSEFVFTIPPPILARAYILALGASILLMLAWLPWKLGMEHMLREFRTDPLFAVVLLILFVPLLIFIALLAYTPASWRAKIECSAKFIRFRPRPASRWMGEQVAEIPITTDANEILICRGSRDPLHLGFRIILCHNNGTDRQFSIATGESLHSRQAERLMHIITTATGLRVRLVQNQLSADGKSEQRPWTPKVRSLPPIGIAALLFAALPFIGGAAAGYFCSGPAMIFLLGIVLWILQTAIVLLWSKKSLRRNRSNMLHSFVTIFTFGASYAAAAAVSFMLAHNR